MLPFYLFGEINCPICAKGIIQKFNNVVPILFLVLVLVVAYMQQYSLIQ